MNLDTHVYCTDCEHFRLDDEDIPYCARPNNKPCNGYDMEDSMSFSERPQYVNKIESEFADIDKEKLVELFLKVKQVNVMLMERVRLLENQINELIDIDTLINSMK